MSATRHPIREELEAGLEWVRAAPGDRGPLELIVRRPAVSERELLEEAELDVVQGLVGDNWSERGSSATADGSAHPEMQLTLMGSRVAALVAVESKRWPLAGDQLYVDLDLGVENLPVGSRLRIGDAVVEITAPPHLGCKKFVERFGLEAMKLVNGSVGRQLRLRGVNAKVVSGGTVRRGDLVERLLE